MRPERLIPLGAGGGGEEAGHARWKHAAEDAGGEQAGILTHIPSINFLFSLFLCLRVVPTFGIHNMPFLYTN